MSFNRPTIFTIQNLCDLAKERIRKRKDALIMICGVRGSGKSVLGFKLSSRVDEFKIERFGDINIFKSFNPKRDMFYTRDDTLEFIRNRKFSICFIDELIGIAYNREFNKEDQQAIIKALNQYRSHFNIMVMNNPFFYDLDGDLRNLVWMRIDVVSQGIGIVHTSNPSLYNNDSWDTKVNQKIEQNWAGKLNKEPQYYKLTTFRGYIYFNDLTELQHKLYESIRDEKRNKANEYLFINSNLQNDKEANFYEKLIKLGEKGELTLKSFENACYLNNEDAKEVKKKMTYRLRKMNSEKKFEDLISAEKQKVIIKDDLGFIKSEKEVKV